jgi:hypothetical protein
MLGLKADIMHNVVFLKERLSWNLTNNRRLEGVPQIGGPLSITDKGLRRSKQRAIDQSSTVRVQQLCSEPDIRRR